MEPMPTPIARRLREGGRLLVTLATGLAALPAVWVLAASAATVLAAGTGLVLFPLALYGVRRWGEAERRRAGRLLGEATADPGLRRRWLLPRLREVVTGRQTWRGVGWLLVHATVGTLAGLVGLIAVAGVPAAVGFVGWWWRNPDPSIQNMGITISDRPTALLVGGAQVALALALWWWVVPPLACGYARLTTIVLSPSAAQRQAAELAARVGTLTETRAEVLDAATRSRSGAAVPSRRDRDRQARRRMVRPVSGLAVWIADSGAVRRQCPDAKRFRRQR